MLEFVADWMPWIMGAAIIARLGHYLVVEVLLYHRPKERTLAMSRRFAAPRDRVWQAFAANIRLTTPGTTFASLSAADVVEYEAGVGPNNEETCTMQVRIVACDPGRYFETHPLRFNGGPYPGGPNCRDGIKLTDDGNGTIATIFLHVETPNLLHAWFMRKAVRTALDKVDRKLTSQTPTPQASIAAAV